MIRQWSLPNNRVRSCALGTITGITPRYSIRMEVTAPAGFLDPHANTRTAIRAQQHQNFWDGERQRVLLQLLPHRNPLETFLVCLRCKHALQVSVPTRP